MFGLTNDNPFSNIILASLIGWLAAILTALIEILRCPVEVLWLAALVAQGRKREMRATFPYLVVGGLVGLALLWVTGNALAGLRWGSDGMTAPLIALKTPRGQPFVEILLGFPKFPTPSVLGVLQLCEIAWLIALAFLAWYSVPALHASNGRRLLVVVLATSPVALFGSALINQITRTIKGPFTLADTLSELAVRASCYALVLVVISIAGLLLGKLLRVVAAWQGTNAMRAVAVFAFFAAGLKAILLFTLSR